MSSSTNFLENTLLNYPSQNPVLFSPGSDNCIRNGSSSSSDNDEGKKKLRMISNRESARRSRMRKQKHLEDMKNQVTLYKKVNLQLMNRLQCLNHNGQIVEQENQRLLLESVMLQQELYRLHHLMAVSELHQTILPSAWPCNNDHVTIVINDQNPPPLVTL